MVNKKLLEKRRQSVLKIVLLSGNTFDTLMSRGWT